MFNPYFEPDPREVQKQSSTSLSGGMLDKLKSLDKDDLLMLALIFALVRNSSKEDIWPLVAVMLYCMLGN